MAIAMAANRTWATFLGVGDAASQKMNIMAYNESGFFSLALTCSDIFPSFPLPLFFAIAEVVVLTDLNATAYTSQTVLKDLVYVDKHPQPDTHDSTMPDLMKEMYGNITGLAPTLIF